MTMATRSATASPISTKGNPGAWTDRRASAKSQQEQLAQVGIKLNSKKGAKKPPSAPAARKATGQRSSKDDDSSEKPTCSRRPGYVKTSVRLRIKTRKKLEEYAAEEGVSLSAVLHSAIEDTWLRWKRRLRAAERKAAKAAGGQKADSEKSTESTAAE